MRRREFIALIGSAAAVSSLLVPVARAQEAGRIYRLGVIAGPARQAPRIVAFFDELRGLGFVEGHNLQIVAGGFGLRQDLYTEVAATVAKSAPDVIFGGDDHAVRAIQEAIHTVPIVGMYVDLRSLARPGGNTTGVSILAPELDGKRQEILMEAVPGARRIAVLADPVPQAHLQALQNAARALSTKDHGRWKPRHELLGASAAGSLFGNDDPSAQGFRVGDSLARVLTLAPGHPVLSALRCLHESAFVQFHLGAADHQLLHKKGITEPEDSADVVVLADAV